MAVRPGPGPSVLDLESLVSMKSAATRPGRGESLADSSHSGHVRFFINRALVVDAVPTDTAFASGRAAMFGRLLAFRAHIHPAARLAVLRSGRIPRRLYYRYRDFNDETEVVLLLKRVASAPEANVPTAVSNRVDVPDPARRELNSRLKASSSCAGRADWIEASRRFEAAALDSGHILDAALARAERVLGACEAPAAWRPEIEARIRGDTALAACRAGLAWRDSAGALAALDQLDRVDGQGLQKGYMLDYLRGRARLAIGDLETGPYLMMGGLGGNPCMAGGWLDLARAYLKGYQPVLAWMCFEAAERCPRGDCGTLLEERARLEHALEARHPEFFE
jgi:hypothetical protein